MDLWSVQVKYSNPTALFPRHSFVERPVSCNFNKMVSYLLEAGRIFEVRHSKQTCAHNSLVVSAMAKKNSGNSSSSSGNGEQSIPGGDGFKGHNPPEGSKSNDNVSPKPHHVTSDWRKFRATLFAREQAEAADLGIRFFHGAELDSKPLGLKWAHPISLPETGSVLVATEKLDGIRTFERSVVLLLRSGAGHPQEGPFGIVINRPLRKKIKHMKPGNGDLTATFGDCPLHFGGPLESSIFLLRTGKDSKLNGFEEVVPGLCFGAQKSLDEAARLVKMGVVKPQDFRFFVGYAGWQLDQLREEIESNYWYVAACNADLIFGETPDSSEILWEETLQLMGGHYSELGWKPKQDM
ncbi:hypothetical protein Nepgr_002529 [Nepenthes gracilis]|uniref:Uncharacterized protein n=1 Tax=Nepenthes gracilis TaxID=150966 RepID=A0AAD3P3Y3_NEPGR|nr:hypothetical protein Nepgr_002529 [Nepenthes gracilis]